MELKCAGDTSTDEGYHHFELNYKDLPSVFQYKYKLVETLLNPESGKTYEKVTMEVGMNRLCDTTLLDSNAFSGSRCLLDEWEAFSIKFQIRSLKAEVGVF